MLRENARAQSDDRDKRDVPYTREGGESLDIGAQA